MGRGTPVGGPPGFPTPPFAVDNCGDGSKMVMEIYLAFPSVVFGKVFGSEGTPYASTDDGNSFLLLLFGSRIFDGLGGAKASWRVEGKHSDQQQNVRGPAKFIHIARQSLI